MPKKNKVTQTNRRMMNVENFIESWKWLSVERGARKGMERARGSPLKSSCLSLMSKRHLWSQVTSTWCPITSLYQISLGSLWAQDGAMGLAVGSFGKGNIRLIERHYAERTNQEKGNRIKSSYIGLQVSGYFWLEGGDSIRHLLLSAYNFSASCLYH